MNKIRHFALALAALTATLSAPAQILSDFYEIDDWGTAVDLKLTAAFIDQLNYEDAGEFKSGDYTWHGGDPLPNPFDAEGKFNGKVVTSLLETFKNMNTVRKLDLSLWDVSHIKWFIQTFEGCNHLQEINLAGWDTSSATSMMMMFLGCTNLETLDLHSFTVPTYDNMEMVSGMFNGCRRLKLLNLENFDLSNVRDRDMILDEEGADSVLLTVIACNEASKKILVNCPNVSQAHSPVNAIFMDQYVATAAPQKTTYFYTYTSQDNGYQVGLTDYFRTQLSRPSGAVVSGNYMWHTGMPLPNPAVDCKYNGKPVVSMSGTFGGITASKLDLDLSRWQTDSVTSMYNCFNNCTAKSINIKGLNTSRVRNMQGLFYCCRQAETITGYEDWKTDSLYNMRGVFDYCHALKSADLSKWNTNKVYTMYNLFRYANALENVNLSGSTMNSVTNASYMFRDCYNLKQVDLRNASAKNLGSKGGMFSNAGIVTDSGTPTTVVYVKDEAAMSIFQNDTSADPARIKFQVAGVTGDINGDGIVDITDVNLTINVVLGKATVAAADINGDGQVDITDVNLVINKVLDK